MCKFCKFVGFHVKKRQESIRFTCQFISKGCIQKSRIDYEETFCPVTRYNTIHTLRNNMNLKQVQCKECYTVIRRIFIFNNQKVSMMTPIAFVF